MKNIEEYREKVGLALKKFLEKKLERDGGYSEEVKKLIKDIIEYNLRGGKRIRPITTIFGYKCFKDDERIINAAICIELMQAYLLIHDDIIDKSDLRRGKPTMHKIYSETSGEEYGNSVAILAGNLCASYMYESIIESDFGYEEKLNAIKYISWINNRENYGQFLDIIPGFENLKEKDVWKIYELKTATYTIQGPLLIGCALAGASEEQTDQLEKYAYDIGVAFQIQDDLIGIFGNVEDTGKPNDSDIKEGKKTLIIAKTLEFCDGEDKQFILSRYGTDVNEDGMNKIKEIVKKCGAFGYCQNKVSELIEKGKRSIETASLREEGKGFLLEMANYIADLYKL